MRVADYLANQIAQWGIRDVFCVTGGGAMHLDDAFGHHPDLCCTYQHHEQATTMAAEAYARVANRPAVALVTTGPGAMNALSGVLGAFVESIPVLVISGQARYATTVRGMGLSLRSTGIQEYDITRAAKEVCKYAVAVDSAADVRYHLERALYLMMHRRRGPVWLDIPLDIQAAQVDWQALRAYDPAEDAKEMTTEPSPSLVAEIIEKLKSAKRPVLFGGYGVHAAGAEACFLAFAELAGIPVLTGMSSVDLIWDAHPLYAGRTGMTGTRAGNLTMAGADLFLSVGSRLSFLQTGFNYQDWAREAFVIANEIDPEELKKENIHVELPVICDARALLLALIEAAKAAGADSDHPLCDAAAWLARCRARVAKYPPVTEAQKAPQADGKANLYAFFEALGKALPEGAQTITSCGSSRMSGTQALPVKKNQRVYTNSAIAAMGFDLPAAIGIARASGTAVNCVTGEGSLMMNLQELMTIRTNDLPVRVFVICNGGYHSIRQTQRAYFREPLIGIGPESGDLDFPAVKDLSKTFGFHYYEIVSNEDLAEGIEAVLAEEGPLLCAVHVTTAQGTEPKAASRQTEDGVMVSAPLEDMAPFLSREELAEALEIPLTEDEKKQ